MKLVSIVAVAIAAMWTIFLALKWRWPNALLYITDPVSLNGPSLFTLFQASAIACGAFVTLWLTHRRTEAISRQAETINSQLEHTAKKDRGERIQHAVELVSGPNSSELSRTGGILLIGEIFEECDAAQKKTLVNFLATVVSTQSSNDYVAMTNKLLEIERNVGIETASPIANTTNIDVHRALDGICKLRSNLPCDFKTMLYQVCINGHHFREGDLDNCDIVGVFTNCTFVKTSFRKAQLRKVRLVNCSFISCDFTEAKLNLIGHNDCQLDSCAIDSAKIELKGSWTVEKNHHAEDSAPIELQSDKMLYQHDIDKRISELEREFNEIKIENEDEELRAQILATEIVKLKEASPAIYIREEHDFSENYSISSSFK